MNNSVRFVTVEDVNRALNCWIVIDREIMQNSHGEMQSRDYLDGNIVYSSHDKAANRAKSLAEKNNTAFVPYQKDMITVWRGIGENNRTYYPVQITSSTRQSHVLPVVHGVWQRIAQSPSLQRLSPLWLSGVTSYFSAGEYAKHKEMVFVPSNQSQLSPNQTWQIYDNVKYVLQTDQNEQRHILQALEKQFPNCCHR